MHEKPSSFDDFEIPQQQLTLLQSTQDQDSQQEILDMIFTDQRRENLLQSASVDRFGRKVRYFRFMPYELLFQFLEEVEQTAFSNKELARSQLKPENLRAYFLEYAGHNNISSHMLFLLQHARLPYLIRRVVGNTVKKDDLDRLTSNCTYRDAVLFIDKYVNAGYIRDRHRGSSYLSPFISLSVGGITMDNLGSNYAYVELLIPDQRIVPNPNGVPGEKEVLVRSITPADISRVYRSTKKLWKEEITNPLTPIGRYHSLSSSRSPVEDWRWSEKTEDYLPVSLFR